MRILLARLQPIDPSDLMTVSAVLGALLAAAVGLWVVLWIVFRKRGK
ncbi:MAG TPA: hypothetical protein VGP63_23195 [Planctomycetaceae bacterium]|nr:hypothetical protein [Planctomycetaceae bacterium]